MLPSLHGSFPKGGKKTQTGAGSNIFLVSANKTPGDCCHTSHIASK